VTVTLGVFDWQTKVSRWAATGISLSGEIPVSQLSGSIASTQPYLWASSNDLTYRAFLARSTASRRLITKPLYWWQKHIADDGFCEKLPAILSLVETAKQLGRCPQEWLRAIVRACIEKTDYPIPMELIPSTPFQW